MAVLTLKGFNAAGLSAGAILNIATTLVASVAVNGVVQGDKTVAVTVRGYVRAPQSASVSVNGAISASGYATLRLRAFNATGLSGVTMLHVTQGAAARTATMDVGGYVRARPTATVSVNGSIGDRAKLLFLSAFDAAGLSTSRLLHVYGQPTETVDVNGTIVETAAQSATMDVGGYVRAPQSASVGVNGQVVFAHALNLRVTSSNGATQDVTVYVPFITSSVTTSVNGRIAGTQSVQVSGTAAVTNGTSFAVGGYVRAPQSESLDVGGYTQADYSASCDVNGVIGEPVAMYAPVDVNGLVQAEGSASCDVNGMVTLHGSALVDVGGYVQVTGTAACAVGGTVLANPFALVDVGGWIGAPQSASTSVNGYVVTPLLAQLTAGGFVQAPQSVQVGAGGYVRAPQSAQMDVNGTVGFALAVVNVNGFIIDQATKQATVDVSGTVGIRGQATCDVNGVIVQPSAATNPPYGRRVSILFSPFEQLIQANQPLTYRVGLNVDGRRRLMAGADIRVAAYIYRHVSSTTVPYALATLSGDSGVTLSADGYTATASFPAGTFKHGRYYLRFTVTWPLASPPWTYYEMDDLVVV